MTIQASEPLEDAPLGYDLFLHKQDECMKVVLNCN